MKFRSPTELDLHVALTSGHTLVIAADDEGTEVPTIFHRQAIARGAVLVDGGTAEVRTQIYNRQLELQEVLQQMIAEGDKANFTADGKPNLMKLKAKAGFEVTRAEADAAFASISEQG